MDEVIRSGEGRLRYGRRRRRGELGEAGHHCRAELDAKSIELLHGSHAVQRVYSTKRKTFEFFRKCFKRLN